MRGRLVLTLAGVAVFLAGYAMQEKGVTPFEGVDDPRFLGLLLEGLGLLLLLSPLLGRRRLPDPGLPRIRREQIRRPEGFANGEEEIPAPPAPPGPNGKDGKGGD